ncbi:MAG: TonB-dependent receptor [Robiginitomaculum sp.]|nr:TonB-dependent receptor [Robiginitomaculum sp.]
MRILTKKQITLSMIILICTPLTTNAQTQIDEIIVTATKRAQKTQDVPISLSVFGTAQIEGLQADGLADLSQQIPNMYQPPAGEAGQSNITIRGIGGGINRTAGRAVGVYIDGVYVSADTALDVAMADVEQVEVLRGPQGTLFGRNTVGGAINITTGTPIVSDTKISGRVQAQYGNFDRKQIMTNVNIPLVKDKLAIRVSGLKRRADGYITNLNGGQKLGSENRTALRGQILFTPDDKLSARLSYDFQDRDDHPNAQGEPITNIGADTIPYTVNFDQEERQTQKAQRATLHLDYVTDNGFTFTSISAWSDVRDFYIQDSDRLPQAITVNQFDGANEDITQEFRLSSPQYERYDYVVGLYYLKTQSLYAPAFPLMSTAFLEQVFFLPPALHPPDELDGQRIVSNNESLALYGHGNFKLTDRLNLFGGLRYTRDARNVDYSIFGETFALFGLNALRTTQSLRDDPLSWTLGGRYRVSDNLTTYISAARAFRSATVKDDFIGQADLDAPSGFFTEPEFVTNYEAGFKFQTPDRHFRLNASAFYMDYTDIQVSISQEPFLFLRTLTNAAKARVWGVEADMNWRMTENLNVGASLGYLKTRYTEFMPEPGRDLSGTGFGTAPELSFSAVVDYQHPLKNGTWQTHLDYANQTAPNDFELRTLSFVGSHAIVNGWTGYRPQHGKWAVKLWVKNLFDLNKPVTNFRWGAGLGPLLDNVTVQYEKPRRYGITLDYYFGQ